MEVIDAIRDGSIEVVATVESFDGDAAHLTDGRTLQPDAVIYATGYRTGLEPLVGHLGLVNDRGAPVASGVTPAAKGLRFVGFTARPGFIGSVARQSRRVARRIARSFAGSRTHGWGKQIYTLLAVHALREVWQSPSTSAVNYPAP